MNGNPGIASLGYLHDSFHVFHLRDTAGQEHEMHYHEFAKIVLFLSGRVDYLIEGTSYPLRRWDILLISGRLAHKAVIDTSEPYERVIIYLDPDAAAEAGGGTDLMACFRLAEERAFYLLRPGGRDQGILSGLVRELERAGASAEFGAAVLERTYLVQLLVLLNRIFLTDTTGGSVPGLGYDARIARTLSYINENLDAELTVGALAQRAYMSRYHFMRLFKDTTGYTVHSYILQKRLLKAAELLRGGESAADSAELCGFRDYSTFLRAFREMFGVTPGSYC